MFMGHGDFSKFIRVFSYWTIIEVIRARKPIDSFSEFPIQYTKIMGPRTDVQKHFSTLVHREACPRNIAFCMIVARPVFFAILGVFFFHQ